MNIYSEWGFYENPFQTTALAADEQGVKLLVGRDTQLKSLSRMLSTPPKCVTIEGPNGIGKTSIANVAAFLAYSSFIEGDSTQLFIPCRKPLQLTSKQTTEEFIDIVLLEVAQTIFERAEELKKHSSKLSKYSHLEKWINNPIIKGGQGAINILGNGGGFASSSTANSTAGFTKSGFRKIVFELLESLFPDRHGGVVCVIDNLELLENTADATQKLEELRDTLLNAIGLRWIICGALGMVRGVVASPRLEGILHKPIEIGGINTEYASKMIETRREVCAVNPIDAYLPLSTTDYEKLYSIFNRNLRQALSMADDYCMWVSLREESPQTEEDKQFLFNEWLNQECQMKLDAVKSLMTKSYWKVFDKAVELNGEFSPSDFALFGYKNNQALTPAINGLEKAQLVRRVTNDQDNRRKMIIITPQGWLVHFARQSIGSNT